MLCIQFSDDSETSIVSFFGGPQDPTIWPNQGEVSTSDPRWKAYFDQQPALLQKDMPQPT